MTTTPLPAARGAASADPNVGEALAVIRHVGVWPELAAPMEDAVARWLASKRSPHTRRAYAADLRLFAWWITEQGETLTTATASHVETWATVMLATGASSATVARRQAAVSSFYTWAGKVDRPLAGRPNPAAPEAIDRVRQSSTSTPALTLDQAAALLGAADRSRHAARDTALVALMLSSGARVAEICAADIDDVTSQQGGCQLQIKAGKGRKARTVTIDPAICDYTDDEGRTTGPLLLSNAGGRLTPDQVANILTRLQRAARIWASDVPASESTTGRASARLDDMITPHVMRASFATLAHEAGAAVDWIQAQMGHSSPVQTQDYIRRTRNLRDGAAMVAAVMATIANARDKVPA